MARYATPTVSTRRRLLAAALGALAVLLVLGVPSALAAAEPPIWKPIFFSEPTHLEPNSPKAAVQIVTLHATKGTFTISETTEHGCEHHVETTEPIAYNATASQVLEQFERICGYGGGERPTVTGNPGGPYRFEFTDTPTPLMEVDSEGLDGGTATVENTSIGQRQGVIIVSVTNVGGTTNGSPITIKDVLPKGLTATKIRGDDVYLGGYRDIGEGTVQLECTKHPETEPLSCTAEKYKTENEGEVPIEVVTGDTLQLVIDVEVGATETSEEVNKVSVSGGGAEPASVSEPVVISKTPATYGPAPGTVFAALSSVQAGAHASLTTAFTMNTDEFGHVAGSERDIRFDLPPGLVGNATQLKKCSMANVLSTNCPTEAMVGMVTLYLGLEAGRTPEVLVTPLYAITPAPGEPVAFAFNALILPVRLDTALLSNGNYGVRVTAPSLSEAAETFSTYITNWGVPADHSGPPPHPELAPKTDFGKPFGGMEPGEQRLPLLTSPQQCGEAMPVIMSTDPWQEPGHFFEAPTTMSPLVGCEALTMQPSFTMLPDTLEAGAPAGYTLELNVPQNDEPNALTTPTVKDLKVALPVGTVVNPSLAWGLKACSAGQFELHSGKLGHCPREAQVGQVEIESPNLPEILRGEVYLAAPECSHIGGEELCTPENAENGEMVKLYVQAVSQGESKTIVKLEGKASINQSTGQITSTFDESPPLPFDRLTLTLSGGPRAALANQRNCGPATTTMDITPWSSPFTEDSNPFYTFNINQNCFGEQFAPKVTPGMTSIQSGEYSPFTLVFGREDDEGFLAGLQQILPPGLLGKVKGITLCQEPAASEGECPESSQVGTVQALTGPGADPFLVTDGKVYLTGHYKGAPFGLSISVPAIAGPYHLLGTNGKGDVVVRAAINVDKENAHLTITADPLPTELDGVPLQIKVLDVTINRPEFTFNPTSCERMHITTTLTSQEGQVSTTETPFQVTNCVGLGFNPRFEVSTQAKTSRADGATLDARLIYPLGKKLANVKNVKVELPKQLPSRLTTLQKACPDHVFDENPEACPAPSRIGQARASTPILPNLLEGWAYFVSHGGAAFPNLVVVLQDRPDGVRVDLVGETFISKAGITSTTFGTVPDVPISEFELYLPEGPDSALAANGNLCTAKNLVMPTIFNGQNGGRLKQNTPIDVLGCAKAAKAKRARRGSDARRGRTARHRHRARASRNDRRARS